MPISVSWRFCLEERAASHKSPFCIYAACFPSGDIDRVCAPSSTGINLVSSPWLSEVCQRSFPRRLRIVFASVQTISRTDGGAVSELRRTFSPSLVDTQSPRPGFPGSLQEKAKCSLSGAQAGREGVVPVSFGVANRSSSVSSSSCAVTVAGITVRKTATIHNCQKEICCMCLFQLLFSRVSFALPVLERPLSEGLAGSVFGFLVTYSHTHNYSIYLTQPKPYPVYLILNS